MVYIGGGLETFMGEAWPYLSWAGIACGFAIFALSILVVLQAGVGSLCLWCDKRAVKRCCCHGCGVQMVGCAWVGASMCGVLLFVLSAVFLLIALAIADVGYVATGWPSTTVPRPTAIRRGLHRRGHRRDGLVDRRQGLRPAPLGSTASEEHSLWSALVLDGRRLISAFIDERTAALANRAELEAASAEIAASKTAIDAASPTPTARRPRLDKRTWARVSTRKRPRPKTVVAPGTTVAPSSASARHPPTRSARRRTSATRRASRSTTPS